MTGTVDIPVWLVVLTGILAVIGLIDRILAPSARWMLRRRLTRAIDDLNTRLKLKIQPFKLARRRELIDRLLWDPQVLKAVEDYAAEHDVPHDVAQHRAAGYAQEIVPAFSAYTYFKVGARLAKSISQLLYRVRLGYSDDDVLRRIDPDSAVVFVMNHRSNMDYVLVTYMAAASSALSYAVGEWAQVFLLRRLIRMMGAYFIRRDTRKGLYRKVLARYVRMATEAGVTQAVFPEGGLSRDGKLRPPKLGLLSYMVCGFDPDGARDIVFIPVGLNYDRVLEDRMLTRTHFKKTGEKPSFKFSPAVLFGFIGHQIALAFKGRWHRFGYACVSFGEPLSMRAHLAERGIDYRGLDEDSRFEEVEALGIKLMRRVGRVVPALPVSLVATAVLRAGDKSLSALELKSAVFSLIQNLEARGAHIHVPRHDRDYAVTVGLRMLTLRHIVHEEDGLYRVNEKETAILHYYANGIAHLFEQESSVQEAAE